MIQSKVLYFIALGNYILFNHYQIIFIEITFLIMGSPRKKKWNLFQSLKNFLNTYYFSADFRLNEAILSESLFLMLTSGDLNPEVFLKHYW